MNGRREGGWVKTEEDPLEVIEGTKAVTHLEQAVVPAGGAVLRYGGFYGPGAWGRPARPRPEEASPPRRRRHRVHVLGAHRRRGCRDGPGRGAEGGGRLQHRGRRAGTGERVAAPSLRTRRGETAAAGARLARPSHCRRDGGRHAHAGAGSPTPRPSASSAGSCAIRRGGRASRKSFA